ncbi:MAG: hypothetical protein HZB40_04875 [Rhodocyclales bacterium]|nr:hypothetical protein [Rhodocyclales bacterium]
MKRIVRILALRAPAMAPVAPPPGHPSPQQARELRMPEKPQGNRLHRAYRQKA